MADADVAAQGRRRRIVVLISGSGLFYVLQVLFFERWRSSSAFCCFIGTNLQALIDAQNTPSLPNAHIVLVVSNRKAAYGLTRAQNANPPIPTRYLALQPYLKSASATTTTDRTRNTYDAEIARIVLEARPDIVVLAGWMHVFGEGFFDAVVVGSSIAVINLHPALPGAFDGTHAIERGYEAFQKGEVDRVGAMVHHVVKEVDRGEPVVVREVEIKRGEPLEAYEDRLHRTEWEIIVEGTRKVLDKVQPA
jgi:formyltetrahydrofolate-dependent phosphoribosylglycinamide formyltransferase